LEDGVHGRTIARILPDIRPDDPALSIDQKHGRARNLFLRMQDLILLDVVSINIRQNRVRQFHFGGESLTVRGRIGTDCDHFRAEALDLSVICLQLTELLATEPSTLGPVKNNEYVLLAFKQGIQANGGTLD
jgi:hypothetical protein